MDRFVSLIDAGQDSQCVIKAHLGNTCGFVLHRIYSSAEEAFREIPNHMPDLVITHVRLPGMMSPVESKSPTSGRIKITHPGGRLCRLF